MTRNHTRTIQNRFGGFLLGSAALLVLPGCVQWNLGESLAIFESEPKPQSPDSVLAVWTDTTLNQPGKPTIRGFGGRVMFFVQGSEDKAVPVEGNVSVYAFDDDRLDQQQPAPEKKFLFPAENLAAHQSDSTLGPSYSFWLPWDNAGGRQRRISLLTRFEDKSGKIVLSKTARVMLPGTSAAAPAKAGLEAGNPPPAAQLWPPVGVQQAGYQQLAPPPYQGSEPDKIAPSLATTTIDVAPGQAQRLLAGQKANRGETASGRAPAWGPLTISQQTIPSGVATSSANSSSPSSPAAQASAARPAGSATDFRRGQSPVRTATTAPPASDPVRRQPHHAEWLRPLPPTPRSGWTTQPEAPPPKGASAEN
jgi:hypothetical protein